MFTAADVNFRAAPDTSAILRCEACGSIYPDRFPTPESLGEAYRTYYTSPVRDSSRRPGRRIAAWLNRSRRAYLDRDLPPGAARVLDYGCGSGDFLRATKAARPDLAVFGTDLRPVAPSPDFQWLAIEELEGGAPFDWITLNHVIEHHSDPRGLVARLTSLLAPGGGVWIATPNADSFLIAASGRWARDIDFPRHRQVFSRAALTDLLAARGLEISYRSPPLLNAVLNARAGLANILADRAAFRAEGAAATAKTLTGLARHVLSPAPARDGKSPELVVICRKRGDGPGRDGR